MEGVTRRDLPKIAFLGTGIMGAPMAAHIARAGFPLTVWNRTAAKTESLRELGVAIARNPSEACFEAEYIFVMLSTGAVVDDVLFSKSNDTGSPAEVSAKGAVFVVMSSIPTRMAETQAHELMNIGRKYIDAPVSGGESGAISGKLTIMAGGDADTIQRAKPILELMGRLTHVGKTGTGQLSKLANQTIVGVTICAVAEAILLAEQGGANVSAMLSALEGGFADSAVLRKHGKNIVNRDFEPGAHAHVQLKDLCTAETQAESTNLDPILLPVVRALFQDMCDHGRSRLDHSGVYLELRDKALAGRRPL